MEFLNYHHLRYFWMVAKEGGLTKAAAKLHVSQPTISAQISALESVLGEKLFRRAGRNLRLTDVGQHVLSYAEEIFSIGEDLLSSVKQRPTSRPLGCTWALLMPFRSWSRTASLSRFFGCRNRCRFPAGKPKSPTCSSNSPPTGWTSCWRTTGLQQCQRQSLQPFAGRMRRDILCRGKTGEKASARFPQIT